MKKHLSPALLFFCQTAIAAHVPAGSNSMDRLLNLQAKANQVEQSLIVGLKSQKQARSNLKKIRELIQLQQKERDLSLQRVKELEKTIGDLEIRRGQLKERIQVQSKAIRKSLKEMDISFRETPKSLDFQERERLEAPRRRVLSTLVDRNLKEIEAFRADLADADQLEKRIGEEKGQLAYLLQDIHERESVLELNRQLHVDILERKHEERVAQLVEYRKLKSAELKVESMIRDFNARMELHRAMDEEKKLNVETLALEKRAGTTAAGAFALLKGSLSLPVSGQVVAGFGKYLDPSTKLQIFRKGIEIQTGKGQAVVAVSEGKVAFSGELPGMGRMLIIDHGDHFYTLCARLGELGLKTGTKVKKGERIGLSDAQGTPVYFEIRSRNIAINPMTWIANSAG